MLANIIRNSKKSVGGGGGGIVIDGGDPYYSAVSLMLSMDGANGSTTFTDSSLNALTVTATSATISTTQSKYGGASGYFNGSSGYVTTGSSSSLAFSGDFTMEAWIYPTVDATQRIVSFSGGKDELLLLSGRTINYFDGTTNFTTSTTVSLNAWSHIAVTKSSRTVRVFINGVLSSTPATSSYTSSSPRYIAIGRYAPSSLQFFNGYIDDLRISRFARYVSNFTPPTAALPTTASSTVADPYYNYTSLLLHMDGANTSTNFVDSGPNALAVTATSSTISTTQSKYGGASGSFNGTSSYLQMGTSNDSRFLFGTGDFTIEFWMYVSAFSGSNIQTPINNYGSTATGWNIQINCVNTNNVRFSYGDTSIALTASNTLVAAQWHHIAVTRSGTSATIWINGTASATTTNSTNISAGAILTIGKGATGANQYFNGYIDDLRITKYARYTASFTPPITAHPNA